MPTHPLLGFILTRNWRDTSAGTEIEYWLATESGPLKVVLTKQISVAFVEAQHKAVVQAKLLGASDMYWRELDLKSFQSQPVLGIYAKKFRQLGKLARALQPLGVSLLEADVRPHERYLMERFITAGVEIHGGQLGNAVCTDCKLAPAPDFRPKLKVVSLDIETSQNFDLYSIALDGLAERVVFMLGEPVDGSAEPADFALRYFSSRKAMIEALNDWLDVIIGWNVLQFDLRVLQKNADEAKVPLQREPSVNADRYIHARCQRAVSQRSDQKVHQPATRKALYLRR